MKKRWAYFIAVLFVLVVRFGVLNTGYDQWLMDIGYPNMSAFISSLKQNDTFNEFVGNWALPVFVVTTLAYWSATGEESNVPMQFLLLPIAYIPFSIVGATLSTAQFHLEYLMVHPLVILTFGYFYVAFWTIFIWVFEKIRLVR